jgi:cell division protein FtsA
MARDQVQVGLEIGTTKVCAVVAECRRDGDLRILGVGESPSRGVRKGEIVDFQNATKCVHDALADAEDRSDFEIKSVWVAITGSHIESFNNRGSITMEEGTEITESEIEDVEQKAKEVSINKENDIIHTIRQHYYVDGREGVINPSSIGGSKLEVDFHIIHGVINRVQTTIRCVREFDIDVRDVVVNSVASAQIVLDEQQKAAGAMVIDIGGGVTDYIVYQDSVVSHSGVIAIGGDHITNDLCIGLRIPLTRAEKLKIEEGSADLQNIPRGDKIILKNDTGFSGKEVDRELLNQIIHARLQELFIIIRKRIHEAAPGHLLGAGIMLTGGCSLIRGIREVAESVFEAPVYLAHAQSVSGPTSAFQNPQLSTAIGLVKYAQGVQAITPPESMFTKLVKSITGKLHIL